MIHLNDDQIRNWLDHGTQATDGPALQAHLETCPVCVKRVETQRELDRDVCNLIRPTLPAKSQEYLALQRAWRQVSFHSNKEITRKMINKKIQTAGIVMGITAALAVSLVFPPVRALASNFLGLFRAEKIAVIDVDLNKLETLHGQYSNANLNLEEMFGNDIQVTSDGETTTVANIGEAAALAGFTPRQPVLDSMQSVRVTPGQTAEITINREKIQRVLDEIGRTDLRLPENVDGKIVRIETGAMVTTLFGACETEEGILGKECKVFAQMPSPVVDGPADLDLKALAEIGLQMIGLSAEDTAKVSANIDWTATLVLPLPMGEGYNYQDVVVDGANGVFVTRVFDDRFMLVWVKDGMVYSWSGQNGAESALEVANNLQ